MVYQWKTHYFKTDANVAGAVCEELERTVGLTSENLVEASRPFDAPLHNEFTWNNQIAADKWRCHQARQIINNLVITTDEAQEEQVRAFFTIDKGHNGELRRYESLNKIMQVETKRLSLLDLALRELDAFRKKYNQLDELSAVFEKIDEVI